MVTPNAGCVTGWDPFCECCWLSRSTIGWRTSNKPWHVDKILRRRGRLNSASRCAWACAWLAGLGRAAAGSWPTDIDLWQGARLVSLPLIFTHAQYRPVRKRVMQMKGRSQHIKWTGLSKSTQLHDAFIGHARQRPLCFVSICSSETGTVK